jgi:hypothetical protein
MSYFERHLAISGLIFCGFLGSCFAQAPLSPALQQKVDLEQNPVQKRKLYFRYLHLDSIAAIKKYRLLQQKALDSLRAQSRVAQSKAGQLLRAKEVDLVTKFYQEGSNALITEDMYRLPAKVEIRVPPKSLKRVYAIARAYLVFLLRDSLAERSMPLLVKEIPRLRAAKLLRERALGQLPVLPSVTEGPSGWRTQLHQEVQQKMHQRELEEVNTYLKKYRGQYQAYSAYANMSPDSLRSLALEAAEKHVQREAFTRVGGQKELAEFQQFQKKQQAYLGFARSLNDSATRKEEARKRAEAAALDYLEKNPATLKTLQAKMSGLMKKYSTVLNSNDLSTAVKRTSLQGRPLRQRLVAASNFQIISLQPVSIDLAPQLGYRFNSRLTGGVGGHYRQTFVDSIPRMAPRVIGLKGFVSYDLVKQFFAYSEYDRNSTGVKIQEGKAHRNWETAYLIGVGRKLALTPKLDVTIVALYNLGHHSTDQVFNRPFVVRFGIQTSETAFLKKN